LLQELMASQGQRLQTGDVINTTTASPPPSSTSSTGRAQPSESHLIGRRTVPQEQFNSADPTLPSVLSNIIHEQAAQHNLLLQIQQQVLQAPICAYSVQPRLMIGGMGGMVDDGSSLSTRQRRPRMPTNVWLASSPSSFENFN
jgi:hypothetical protein